MISAGTGSRKDKSTFTLDLVQHVFFARNQNAAHGSGAQRDEWHFRSPPRLLLIYLSEKEPCIWLPTALEARWVER